MKTTNNHRQWQQAQQRTLKYLDALGVEPVRALSIARQALSRAARNRRGGSANSPYPVTAAMRELRHLLSGNQHPLQPPMHRQGRAHGGACTLLKPSEPKGLAPRSIIEGGQRFVSEMPVMPPIRRAHMVPEKIRPLRLKSMIAFFLNRSDS